MLACHERHRHLRRGMTGEVMLAKQVDCQSRFGGLAFWMVDWCWMQGYSAAHGRLLDFAETAEHSVEHLRLQSKKVVVLEYAEG